MLSTKDCLAELNELVGLDAVKTEVNRLINMIDGEAHHDKNEKSQIIDNYIFIGNPGTGKTTVGRIMSNIFQSIGILPTNNFVQVSLPDFVSGFCGETPIKTSQIIDKVIGGVLFIDDLYSFSKSNRYAQEALETLLKRMEDDRGKFVVIGAGYKEKMKYFLDLNPGFKYRCKTIIFEDFTIAELEIIFRNLVNNSGYKLSRTLENELSTLITEMYNNSNINNFGNAREMRILHEKAKQQQSTRLAKQMADGDVSDDDIVIFEKEDLL